MMLPLHLQTLLNDPVISVVHDNACTHGQRLRCAPRRTHSLPSRKGSLRRSSRRSSASSQPVSRWESIPTKSAMTKDMAPVLKERKGDSVPSLLQSVRFQQKDVAPVLRGRRVRTADERQCALDLVINILESLDDSYSTLAL
jgi:hypothetical protein